MNDKQLLDQVGLRLMSLRTRIKDLEAENAILTTKNREYGWLLREREKLERIEMKDEDKS